jgi:hypothetical protein
MPTFQEEQNARGRLAKNLDNLAIISPESLVRKEKLGDDLNFEAGLPYFKKTLKLFQDLKQCSLDNIPLSTINTLSSHAEGALGYFSQIQNFSIQSHPNPLQMREQMINQISNSYDGYFTAIAPIISYSIRKGTDFESLEKKAQQIVGEMHETQTSFILNQEKAKKEADSIIEAMRQVSAESGIAQHSFLFQNEAHLHQKIAKYWLGAVIIMGIFTFLLALYSIGYYSANITNLSPGQSIQLGIAKIIGFSVLYFGLVWTGKNYRSHRHNYVINKHRQNALNTFQAFVKATDDESTKNAVLLRSTEAIFSPCVTGYLTKEPESQGTSQIFEVIRNAFEKEH